jgi:hypothetical protein
MLTRDFFRRLLEDRKGQKGPADIVANAIRVARILIGEVE